MAKIDVAKITDYASMTPEQKLAALEAFEYDDAPLGELEKYKAAVSKANTEAADWKKKHNALLSDEERKEAERAASEAAVKAELEALRKENTVTKTKAQFLGLGYDEKLAADTAAALAGGDMDKVIANQKIHIETIKKIERAAALAGDQKPPAGAGARATDFSKEIAEAQANSDYGLAAMLMRQQQEPTMQK